jgi:hypothetical protein
MLRGDPVIISPVQVYGAEYLSDIGWPGRALLDLFPTRIRRYWRFFEVSSVFGTVGLAFLELYLLLNQAFLYAGVAAIVVWALWLLGNHMFWTRRLARVTARGP